MPRISSWLIPLGICLLAGCTGGRDGGTPRADGATPRGDGGVTRLDGGGGTPGEVCPGFTPNPGATACRSQEQCTAGGGDVCYPPGTGCCPVKSIAPRDCESPGDCATGEVCEEYDATGFCTSGTGSRCVADCRMSGEPCTDATCDEASGLCLALACPTAWTCATNHDCNAASPGADVHGCVRRACENATVCDCGECVGGACWDGPGHCGGLCDCAAPDTPVATPDGDRPLAELREGDLVYSVDAHGVVVVPLARASRRPVDPAHEVVRVELEDGRSFEMSPGHPTAEGTPLGEIRVGEVLGTSVVRAVTMVSYPHAYTHDILPASDSRAYFASGALVGSTLTR